MNKIVASPEQAVADIPDGATVAIAGFGVLAAAMSSAILLVTDYLFGATTATICTAGAAVVLYGLWYVAPITRRRRRAREA